MKRGIERKLLIIGSIWNLVTALLTIFSYNSWFTKEGEKQLLNSETNTMIAGSQMINNISSIIFLFGLFVFVGALVNFLIAVILKDNEIQYKLMIWIGIWAAIQLLSMDILGFLIYMVAFVIYMAKNKAIKMSDKKLKSVYGN